MMYAPHATPRFNAWLHETLLSLTAEVRKALDKNLVALLLGGGYGRGEGGAICRNGVEQPYNDLELAVIVHCPWTVECSLLEEIREKYGRELGVHVHLTEPLTVEEIQKQPHSPLWMDFVRGYVVLEGPADLLAGLTVPTITQPLPPIEATRLLLNRGAELLWAWRVWLATEAAPDADSGRRSYHRCALALGDALLILYERYSPCCQERELRLNDLVHSYPEIMRLDLTEVYTQGMRFRFCPDDVDRILRQGQMQRLTALWGRVYLHIERQRTGHPFRTLEDYETWTGLREPFHNRSVDRLRNLLLNLPEGRVSLRHPREELFRTLPRLLLQASSIAGAECGVDVPVDPFKPNGDREIRALRETSTKKTGWIRNSGAFLSSWQRCRQEVSPCGLPYSSRV